MLLSWLHTRLFILVILEIVILAKSRWSDFDIDMWPPRCGVFTGRITATTREIRSKKTKSMLQIHTHSQTYIDVENHFPHHGVDIQWPSKLKAARHAILLGHVAFFPSQIPLKSALPILFQMFLILPFSNPGALLGRSNFGDLVFTGTLMIRSPAFGTTPDDDYVGLIFGFQSNMSVLKYTLLRRWKLFIQIQLKQRI